MYKQTFLRKKKIKNSNKYYSWTRLIQSGDAILIEQFDGENIETIAINKDDINKIINILNK